MAKKKNNTNLFLLIALVAIGAVYFFVTQADKKKGKSTFRSELVNYNSENVTKIKIKPSRTPNDIVELNKVGDDWKTTLKDGRTIVAQKAAVDGIFAQLETIKPNRVAANNKGRWSEYKVDEQGTVVEFFNGSEKVVDLVLGKFDIDPSSLQGQQQFGGKSQPKFTSYVRLSDEEKVYAVDGFYEELNGQKVDNFRDKDIFKGKSDVVTQVRFNYPDSSFQLTYNDSWKINGKAIDSTKVVNYLRTLENMTISEFAGKPKKSKSDLSINIKTGGNTTTLNAFVLDSANYILQSSEMPLDYFSGKNVFNRVFVSKSNFSKARAKSTNNKKAAKAKKAKAKNATLPKR